MKTTAGVSFFPGGLAEASASNTKRCVSQMLGKKSSLEEESDEAESAPASAKVAGQRRAEQNAERDCHQLFGRLGLSLPIPIEKKTFEVDSTNIVSDYVLISDWLKYILHRCPCLLAGADAPLSQQLTAFWTMFQWSQPGHVAFESPDRLSRTIPLMLYGDEGKGPKRGNYMITSVESPIGLGDAAAMPCECQSFVLSRGLGAPDCYGDVAVQPEVAMADRATSNVKGNSYLTRHLLFGLPDFVYKDYPEVYDGIMNVMVDDLLKLHTTGVSVRGQTFYAVLIANKGDLKHMAEKVCKLTRSYAHLSNKNQLEICHLCLAGGPGLPWEEAGQYPSWAPTMFVARPWSSDPVLSRAPFEVGRPESLYQLDLFHLFKVGIGRDIAGGICLLARLGYYDNPACAEPRNLLSRLRRAHKSFRLWCLATHNSAGLRYFSPSFFNVKKMSDFAWTNSKGSDTMLLLQYLLFFVTLHLQQMGMCQQPHRQLFRLLQSTIRHGLKIFEICHSHGMWLQRVCGQSLYLHIEAFLNGYQQLARTALNLNLSFFAMKPKFHGMKHIAFQLRETLLTPAPRILNPVVYSCDTNEDSVGKLCSLALIVSTRTINRRVLQRSFLKKAAVVRRHLDFRRKKRLRL